jgi:hypothetical protein
VPGEHHAAVVGQVGRQHADAGLDYRVVVAIEPQLALEQRIGELELPDHHVDRQTEELVELEEGVLELDRLALLEDGVEVVGDLLGDRPAGRSLSDHGHSKSVCGPPLSS